MSLGLAGRRVLITGGASGIGAAVARQLVREGAEVHLLDLNESLLAKLAAELGAGIGHCDVTDERAFQAAHDTASEAGPFDGLVCCAGVPDLPGSVESLSQAAWSRILDSHLTGTFNACRIAGAAMAEAGGGAIVNLASVLSFNAGPIYAYGAAKAAVVNLTASLGVHWAARGVRVNAVAPGWVDTPFLKPKERSGTRDYEPILAATPLGRLLRPEEIAEVVCFLLSPRASAIVGTTVSCDGGVVAGAGWTPFGGFEASAGARP